MNPATIATPLRARARQTALQEELLLGLAMAGLLVVVSALSAVGGGSLGRAIFMASALAIASLAKRRSPWLFLSASLWIWLTTAFIRRMIEWHSGFNPTDIVLVTPSLTALLIVPDILRSRGLLNRPGVGYALLLTACVTYGLFVSFVRGSLLGAAMAGADWLVPLLYLYLFICHAERIDEAEGHFAPFLSLSLLFVVPYTLYQYFRMPDWDATWMIGAEMGSLGSPLPMGSRVFGPLNNPGFLAIWAGTCVVLLSHFRSWLLLALAPFLFLVVAITQVRCVYASMLLAIGVGALIGRGGFGRMISIIVVAMLSGYVGLAVLDPQVTDQLTTRFATFGNLSSDTSAEIRAELYAETPALIDKNPFGTGIGAQGRGAAGQQGSTIAIDSGPLSVLLGLGWIAGPLYMLGMGLLQLRVLPVGRRRNSPVASAMAAAAICPLATFPFLNVIQFEGVILWVCLGYALAVEIKATMAAPARQGARSMALEGVPL